jgi:hypothetical protein
MAYRTADFVQKITIVLKPIDVGRMTIIEKDLGLTMEGIS